MITAEQIQQWIQAGLPGCEAIVEGDDGTHFNAIIVSDSFRGKSLLQQQRMVYSALGARMANGEIHALALKTYTPDEWAGLRKS